MAAYLIHYTDFAKDLQVLKFADAKLADIYGFEKLPPQRTAKVVSGEENFKDYAQFSTSLLVAIYNGMGPDKPVSKFENHVAAARRTFALLYAKHNQLEITEVTLAPPEPPSAATDLPINTPDEETISMPKSAGTTKKSTKSRATNHKPAGTVAEFKPTRAGTDRAKVLALMDGTKTPNEIAAEMKVDRFTGKYVMAHAYCLSRDCGIGYELDQDGKLVALYPRGRSLDDAIKETPVKRPPGPRGRTPAEPPAAEPEVTTVN